MPKSVTLPLDFPSPASMDGKAQSNDLGLAEIEELENEIQKKSMRIRDLEDDVFKYKRQLKRSKRDVDDLNKRLSNYKDLQKQDEVHENMRYQISSLKSQLEDAERKNATLNSPNSSMAPPPPPPDANTIKQEQEANQKFSRT